MHVVFLIRRQSNMQLSLRYLPQTRTGRDACSVPITGVSRCSKRYSITSSKRRADDRRANGPRHRGNHSLAGRTLRRTERLRREQQWRTILADSVAEGADPVLFFFGQKGRNEGGSLCIESDVSRYSALL